MALPSWAWVEYRSARGGGAAATSEFAEIDAPELWQREIQKFGREVSYFTLADPDTELLLMVIWKEGADDEEVSPGSYSSMWVQNSDLGDGPVLGDRVASDSSLYDIVRIDASAIGYSRLVLKEDRSA